MEEKDKKSKPAVEIEATLVAESLVVEQPKTARLADVDVSQRYEDVTHDVAPDGVTGVEWYGGAYVFRCDNQITLRVYVIENGLIRLWYHPLGQYGPHFSYATSPTFHAEKPFATLTENDREFIITTPLLQVVVQRQDLKVKFYDAYDQVICEDNSGYHASFSVMKGWSKVTNQFKLPKKAGIFGLGDKTTPGSLRGKSFENWCTDAFGYGDQSDPLYRAIPFFYVLQPNQAYGIFLDNTYKTTFDFGKTQPETLEIGAEGGDLNYYFIYGPSPVDVSKTYHRLTGTHALPPMWALGYHQCRWSYFPDVRVKEVANQFREMRIPCDALYLDIDYMDSYKCFTWDHAHFPNPKQLISEVRAMGMRTIVMINPGIKADDSYSVYQDGMSNGHFLKNAEGETVLAPVWPGLCVFPDFTKPAVREWFGNQYKEFYQDLGIDGFWNDMNEPAVFYIHAKTLPDHIIHNYDGLGASHRKAHNVYGMLMARSTSESLSKLKPEHRPFLLTRASYAGGQRFAALWTGDNYASWEHLQIANLQAVRLSVSGFSFVGSDIGGFAGEPEPELYLRWLQLAVFHPLMRVHSMGNHASGDNLLEAAKAMSDREPWCFGEKWTPLTKKAIELRYCLQAYLYTAFYRLKEEGIPVLRHLAFEQVTDVKMYDNDRDFLFGDHIIVSPVIAPKVQRQMIHLPSGAWFHFWTGQLVQGGSDFFINVQIDEIPFFVREGAVLPIYPIRQHSDEKIEELTLYAYYKDGKESSVFYEDDGDGFDNERSGWFTRMDLFTEGDKTKFALQVKRSGSRPANYAKITVIAVGLPYYVRKCMIDGIDHPIREMRVREKSIYSAQVTSNFQEIVWSAETI